MNMPHAITKKRPTITPAAVTKRLDITPISHSDTTCMPPIIQRKQLNISPRRTVPTNYGGNLSEAKQVDRDVKIHPDFRIRSNNNLLQQIANFVATLEEVYPKARCRRSDGAELPDPARG
jgi:hypothetical protein